MRDTITKYEHSAYTISIITGPPNGPVMFSSLASVVCRRRLSSSVTLPADRRAGRLPGARAVERPTLHGGPVVLRPVRVTPCYKIQT